MTASSPRRAGPVRAAFLLAYLLAFGVPSPAAAEGIAGRTYDIEKIAPGEFRGDVRELPQISGLLSVPKIYRREPRGPRSTKKPPPGQAVAPESVYAPLAPMPAPLRNFAGLSFDDLCNGGLCGGVWPPDPNGDVGLNHYIEAVNEAYAIYDKTGTLLAAFTENALWGGSGSTPCNGHQSGDPIVLYDTLADRWILTHLAIGANTFYECIAVSKSGDPVSGGWWLYPIRTDTGAPGQPPTGTLNDYPKFGLWTDCLYYTANAFTEPVERYIGVEYGSFSRSDLYSGAPLTGSLGLISTTFDPFTMIPGNLRATAADALPPPGTPNYLVSESLTVFVYEVRTFTVGPNCSSGTLSAPTNVSETTYTAIPVSVPQPNTTNRADAIDDRLMQKVQYRRVGDAESLWVIHNVQNTGGTVRPQWAQIDVTAGTIATTPVQEQIFAPDTTLNRWMGSIAADRQGNVAIGYSTSNGTSPNFPSIAYAGRLATDPLDQLPRSEVQLIAGAGSQTNSCGGGPCTRWGDYTAMSVDPADDCTFWYVNEYYSNQANGTNGDWQTRIGSFKFPSCSSPVPTPTQTFGISGHIEYYGSALPVSQVQVQLQGPTPTVTSSDGAGLYAFNGLAGGSWQVVPAKSDATKSGITPEDAVSVLHAVVNGSPGATQMLACDVNGDGQLTPLDAVYILQFVVGSIARLPVAQTCGSDWIFIPTPAPVAGQQVMPPQISAGGCQPGAIAFQPLMTPAAGQDFVAMRFGDCNLNWQPQ